MQTKTAFWATLSLILALCAVPSALWVRALRDYYRFLTAFEPHVIRPTRPVRIPHGHPAEALTFVEFRHKAPKAARVALTGDFTPPMAMSRQSDGIWEALVPLPPGRYRYHYLVDGAQTPDQIRTVGQGE